MYNFNKVILMGRLTRDPELKVFQDGGKVTHFGIATNRMKAADANGNREEEVCYVDCKAWGKLADVINNNFSTGRPIFIEGRLKYDSWTDKNDPTKQRNRLIVVVSSFEFVDSKNGTTSVSTTTVDPADVTFDTIEDEVSQGV